MNIAATGSGAVGKTSVMEIIAEIYNLPFMPSVVRGFYASKGMPEGETALINEPIEKRLQFQEELFNHYCVTVTKFAKDNPGGFVTDRTPLCHFGYLVLYAPMLVTLPTVNELVKKGRRGIKYI